MICQNISKHDILTLNAIINKSYDHLEGISISISVFFPSYKHFTKIRSMSEICLYLQKLSSHGLVQEGGGDLGDQDPPSPSPETGICVMQKTFFCQLEVLSTVKG